MYPTRQSAERSPCRALARRGSASRADDVAAVVFAEADFAGEADARDELVRSFERDERDERDGVRDDFDSTSPRRRRSRDDLLCSTRPFDFKERDRASEAFSRAEVFDRDLDEALFDADAFEDALGGVFDEDFDDFEEVFDRDDLGSGFGFAFCLDEEAAAARFFDCPSAGARKGPRSAGSRTKIATRNTVRRLSMEWGRIPSGRETAQRGSPGIPPRAPAS